MKLSDRKQKLRFINESIQEVTRAMMDSEDKEAAYQLRLELKQLFATRKNLLLGD